MIKLVFKWSKWLSFSLITLLVLITVLIVTIFFTHPGLRLVVWGAEKALPQLQVEEVQGALFPRFELQNVRFVDETLSLDAQVERLVLALDAHCLLAPRVCVDELVLQGVNFQMPQLPAVSAESPAERPPVRSVRTPVPVIINNVHLNDIHLNILGNQIDWQSFSTALSMKSDRLQIAPTTLQAINVALATGEVESEALSTPQPDEADTAPQDIVLPDVWIPLTLEVQRLDIHDFKLAGATPVIVNHLGLIASASGERVDVNTLELDMPEVDAKLNTQVTLSADYPIKAQLDALVKQANVKGQKLALSLTGSLSDLSLNATLSALVQGEIEAQLQPLKAQLPFDVSVKDAQAQWPLTGPGDYQVSLPSLALKGSLDGYQVALESQASGKNMPAVDVTLNGQGTLQHIDLENLVVNTLGGELSGQVMVNWAALLHWQADLNLQHIQPGMQWEEAEGDISGRLSTSGSLTEQGGWQVNLPQLNINGILRGHPLHVEGQLDASDRNGKGEDLQLNTEGLALSHGPNQLSAKGKVDKQILMDVKVNFPDFAKSVPDLGGNMLGNVALRGSVQEPEIKLDLVLNQVRWQQQVSVESMTLLGDIMPLPAPKANLSLVAKHITYDELKIESADLEFFGGEQQHQLTLDVVSDMVSTSLEIEGALTSKPQMIWDGALRRLALSSPQGPWSLEKSTAVTVNIDKQLIDVQAHCWLQAKSSVCLSEDVSIGKSGEAKLAVNQFDFNQIKTLLPPETTLTGSLNAQGFVKWAPKSKPQVRLQVDMSPGEVRQALAQPITLGWESGQFKAALAQDKLDAEWLFDVQENGDLSGQVSLTNVTSDNPVIDGRLSLSTFHLDFLAPLIGEFSVFKVNLNTDLALSGAVMHPKVTGQLLVDQMTLQGDVAPLDINSGQVRVNFSGHQAELEAGIVTPDGKLEVTGQADWRDLHNWNTKLRVFAQALQVDLPPMVKIRVEPDMTIDITPQLAKVEGDINLPWGRIVVEELPPSAVGISPDSVILDENLQPVEERSALPFNVETNVNIQMGDDFQLEAFGLKGGLKGSLKVTQKDQVPFIVGEVNIIDGSYRSFGQDLVIEEGKILMNGPADQPYLAIKAIRNPDNTQDGVKAGVQVSGPASDPSVTIFSDPAMNQANALSYLLRGQDIDAEAGSNSMTTTLIGLSLAQSGRVVGAIGEAFGVQDLQLDTAGSGDDSQVTVSGYILPGLQVKYGVGIFNSLGEFTIRYRLMQDLYLEAVSGVDSAVDLIYQFEFD